MDTHTPPPPSFTSVNWDKQVLLLILVLLKRWHLVQNMCVQLWYIKRGQRVCNHINMSKSAHFVLFWTLTSYRLSAPSRAHIMHLSGSITVHKTNWGTQHSTWALKTDLWVPDLRTRSMWSQYSTQQTVMSDLDQGMRLPM